MARCSALCLRPGGVLVQLTTAVVLLASLAPLSAQGQPAPILDLATATVDSGILHRVHGAEGTGRFGVPVAGGGDVDGDGFEDYAVAYMTAAPGGLNRAGKVELIFGDGTINGSIDTALNELRVVHFLGTHLNETAGNEIWMDDVTGDGIDDLLICRQNFSNFSGRIGAGALTIVVGSAALRAQANSLLPVDLGSPPSRITLTHIVGAAPLDRLCIWARTGDVTGDGIADLVVGADQRDGLGESNRGTIYVLRGGPHLAAGGLLNLAAPNDPPLAGNLAEIRPPVGSLDFHFGATCQIADLDGNGRGEVLAAAALNRAGASLDPPGAPGAGVGSSGAPNGRLYIAWDDNFPKNDWGNSFSFRIDLAPGSHTVIRGEAANLSFGEEILGGRDYDNDGRPDLFVGDLVADGSAQGDRPRSGLGYLLFDAARLRGLDFAVDAPPLPLRISRILGPDTGALGGDTAIDGDFDGDSIDDLAFASPHSKPLGRTNAGRVQVLFGQPGGWPADIDLAPGAQPPRNLLRLAEILGAHGRDGADEGDTLAYSGAPGDVNGDGRTDLISNEMVGNGVAAQAIDVGNLVVISGTALIGESIFTDGFNSGELTDWSTAVPPQTERKPAHRDDIISRQQPPP